MPQDLTEFHGTNCLNCGAQLTGNFCAECGQRATDVNMSVQTLAVEFVESLFSLEMGFWQTFKRLVLFPGALTEEYIAGRRKRYSSPIKLYLLTSLLFFFLFTMMGGDNIKFTLDEEEENAQVLTGEAAIDALRSEMGSSGADSTFSASFDFPGGDSLVQFLDNPEATKSRFFSFLPRAMFLMVPLLALLLKMVYHRHKLPYLHYLVFALHLHALFYLTASLASLLGRIPLDPVGEILSALVFLSFPVNTVRAQRRTYCDSWFKAVLKAGFIWNFYGFFLIIVVIGVTALSLVST